MEAIWTYSYQNWGARQAHRYLANLRDIFEELSSNPSFGKRRDELREGLRVYPAGKHLVFYLTTEKGIDVVRILHERMDIDRHLP